MNISNDINRIRKIKNKTKQIDELTALLENITNTFMEAQNNIEYEIDCIIDNASRSWCKKTGYWSVEDVTQNITIVEFNK